MRSTNLELLYWACMMSVVKYMNNKRVQHNNLNKK